MLKIHRASARLAFLLAFAFMVRMAANAAPAGDIVKSGSGLTLGRGWYSLETLNGRPFHWANNDSVIIIHRPQKDLKKIALEIQGGPGLNSPQNFTLHLRNSSSADIAIIHIPGSQKVRFDIPVRAGQDTAVTLHVDGGGKRIPKDPRILNYRVFSIDDASEDTALAPGHPDIESRGMSLGKGWYPLEEFKGETFRWVANDAEIAFVSNTGGERNLHVLAASGPAAKDPAFWTLDVQNASGKTIKSVKIRARGDATFSLPVLSGTNAFRLHVESTSTKAPHDPRTLSFRVFKIYLQ